MACLLCAPPLPFSSPPFLQSDWFPIREGSYKRELLAPFRFFVFFFFFFLFLLSPAADKRDHLAAAVLHAFPFPLLPFPPWHSTVLGFLKEIQKTPWARAFPPDRGCRFILSFLPFFSSFFLFFFFFFPFPFSFP